MGSPITFSGFNNIDFNLILSAIMRQERQPVEVLESQRSVAEQRKTAFADLASKLAALESAAASLVEDSALDGTTATVSDQTSLQFAAGATGPGTYVVDVLSLARAQVTASTSSHADRDTTIVASGGTLSIGGVDVTLSGDVTLDGLAIAINETEGIGVSASVLQDGSNYRLVLTGRETGVGNEFTVANGLTGGTGVTFDPTPAVVASDAVITLNGIQATSSSNTFSDAIAGSSFTVLRESPGNPVTIIIAPDSTGAVAKVQTFVTAYNELSAFLDEQSVSTENGFEERLGDDPLVRGLRRSLAGLLTSQYDVGGSYASLAEIGFSFARTGELEIDETRFNAALSAAGDDVVSLFSGGNGVNGVFAGFAAAVEVYTEAGGLVPNAQEQLTTEVSRLTERIADLEERLELRRLALQQEFIAADLAIAQLNAQRGQMGALGGQFQAF